MTRKKTDWRDQDDFTIAYLECALWSSLGKTREFIDQECCFDDITGRCLDTMIADCKAFLEAHKADIGEHLKQAGHDFWLTRNGHGCGFLDSDRPFIKEAKKRLYDAASKFKEFDLFVDRGKGGVQLSDYYNGQVPPIKVPNPVASEADAATRAHHNSIVCNAYNAWQNATDSHKYYAHLAYAKACEDARRNGVHTFDPNLELPKTERNS